MDLARQAGNLDGMADMLSELGAVALKQGQLRRAASLRRRARSVFRRTGNRAGEAHALNGLGEALLAMGRPGDACAEFAAALGLASRIGLRSQQARAHRGLGRAWYALGEPGKARRHWQRRSPFSPISAFPSITFPSTSLRSGQTRTLPVNLPVKLPGLVPTHDVSFGGST